VGNASTRKPLPALVFLLVLGLLAAIVWWRVLHRNDAGAAAHPVATVSLSCAPGTKRVSLPKPAAVSVEVLNGAGRDGLAAEVSSDLKAAGFKITAVATAPQTQTGIAEIRFAPAQRAAATVLAYHVTGASLVPVAGLSTTLSLTLGSDFKALATVAAANAGLASYNKTC
jgi:hypothetical protein